MRYGFTLVEMLVAVGLFAAVAVIIAGATASTLRAQQRIFQKGAIVNQVSYAFEYMGRTLRMARKDDIGEDCLGGPEHRNYEKTKGGRGIAYQNVDGQCREFYWDQNTERLMQVRDGANVPLTGPNIAVTDFHVRVIGQNEQDNRQPRVTLRAEVTSPEGSLQPLSMQITVSQRNLDIER